MKRHIYWIGTAAFLVILVLAACDNRQDTLSASSRSLPASGTGTSLTEKNIGGLDNALETLDPFVTYMRFVLEGVLPVIPYQEPQVQPTPTPAPTPGPNLVLDIETVAFTSSGPASPTSLAARLPEAKAVAELSQVPALARDPLPKTLHLPLERLIPPPAGGVEVQTFPPAAGADLETPVIAESTELQVVRFSPSGQVSWAPNISLTFSQPMVPLTSHAELADQELPVFLVPGLAGEWYWMGTQTLVFQPAELLADSTLYLTVVPANFTALSGAALKQHFIGEFETPRMTITRFWPQDGPQTLQPHIAMEFSQPIDRKALLPFITLEAQGQAFPLVLVSPESPDLSPDLKNFLESTVADQTILLQPAQAIPADTVFTVTVHPGAQSTEGPLPTQEPQRNTLYTYGSLQVSYVSCQSIGSYACHPDWNSFDIGFNHRVDPHTLITGMVSIRPFLPQGKVRIYPSGSMRIEGETEPDTWYTLRIEPGLKDIYGQVLDSTQEFRMYVGEYPSPEAVPMLHMPAAMEVMYPHNQGRYSFFARDLSSLPVQLYEVEPADFAGFQVLRHAHGLSDPARLLEREPLLDTNLTLNSRTDAISRTVLDLNPYLKNGKGQLLMVLDPPSELFSSWPWNWNFPRVGKVVTWIQATALALDAYADPHTLIVHATSLETGESQAGVHLALWPEEMETITDADGHAHFDIAALTDTESPRLILGSQGQDITLLPQSLSPDPNSRWRWPHTTHTARWHVFTDRHLYRPGEEMQIKGWVRQVEYSPAGDVSWLHSHGDLIHYRIQDSHQVELGTGTTRLDEHGAIHFRFQVPENANLGYARVYFSLQELPEQWAGQSHHMYFQIEEFRRPEFETSVTSAAGPHFVDETVTVDMQSQYYGGGPLQGASASWHVYGREAYYSPPGWHRYRFGQSYNRWTWYGSTYGQDELDTRGYHRLAITPSVKHVPVPHTIHVSATVQDLSQQSVYGTEHFLVHPASLYVGAKRDSYLAEVEVPYPLDLIVTDIDGQLIPDQEIQVQTRIPNWVAPTASDSEKAPEPSCRMQSASAPVTCELVFPHTGYWLVDIAIRDEKGRPNVTQFYVWVTSSVSRNRLQVGGSRDQIDLTPDRDEYQPGDMARILIQPPFYPAYGTVITNRDGIVTHESIEILNATHIWDVPIKESHLPNVHVSVLLSGAAPDLDLGIEMAPAMARGDVSLNVPPSIRELALDVHLDNQELAPGGQVSITVQVTDAERKPVSGAEVVLFAVDEAILALTGYQHRHPLDSFYPLRNLHLSPYQLRRYMQSEAFLEREHPPGGRGGGGNGGDFAVRSDFNPLAFYEPSGITNEEGVFRATWDLPDTISRFRVVAMATSGPQLFGLAESSFVTRLPLQIRPQWPRFLNYGDTAEVSILVENLSQDHQDLTLIAQSDRLEMSYESEELDFDAIKFAVPARSRQQILVPVEAREAGESQVMVTVFNDQINDTVLGALPVYVPASQEGFAAYGIVEDSTAVQGLRMPDDVHRDFGQLTIATSSTLLQSLLDCYLQLGDYTGWNYPERIASRILAHIALRDVLYAFQLTDLPEPEVLDQSLQVDIDALMRFQQDDGGFPQWVRGEGSWPFVSVHSLHALAVARDAGYAVPKWYVQRGLNYLTNIESHYPWYYSPATRRYITAYALFVRSQLGDVVSWWAQRLLESVPPEDLDLEVVAWSLLALQQSPADTDTVAEWMEFVHNRVDETTGKAVFARHALEQDGHLILQSARRSDALLLRVLMTIQPDSDLIPKVVKALMAARGRHGHWGSSQDNVFVLQSMDQYFRTYEATDPDFMARVWLDDTLVMNTLFQGRETEIKQVSLPMAWLFTEDPERLQVQREGEGRLYYRLGLDYVPDDLRLEPRERGFSVMRTYSGLDDPDDVWQDAEGIWHVKLGSRVRIDVTLVATGQRHHVMLASPLPAGLELVNPALKGSEPFEDPNRRGWYYWPWFDHQQLLDERALTVTTWLPGGVYQYAAIAEATTAGTFQVPPARAAEIYAPETFGYGPSEVLMVEPE